MSFFVVYGCRNSVQLAFLVVLGGFGIVTPTMSKLLASFARDLRSSLRTPDLVRVCGPPMAVDCTLIAPSDVVVPNHPDVDAVKEWFQVQSTSRDNAKGLYDCQ